MTENKYFISGPEIPMMETQHSDNRRTISEVVVPSPEGEAPRRVTLLEIGDEGGALGNHYHMNAPEFFAMIEGTARLITANHKNPTETNETVLATGESIEIPAGTTHTFVFEDRAVMMSSMDGEFDPSDMHAQKLL